MTMLGNLAINMFQWFKCERNKSRDSWQASKSSTWTIMPRNWITTTKYLPSGNLAHLEIMHLTSKHDKCMDTYKRRPGDTGYFGWIKLHHCLWNYNWWDWLRGDVLKKKHISFTYQFEFERIIKNLPKELQAIIFTKSVEQRQRYFVEVYAGNDKSSWVSWQSQRISYWLTFSHKRWYQCMLKN